MIESMTCRAERDQVGRIIRPAGRHLPDVVHVQSKNVAARWDCASIACLGQHHHAGLEWQAVAFPRLLLSDSSLGHGKSINPTSAATVKNLPERRLWQPTDKIAPLENDEATLFDMRPQQ